MTEELENIKKYEGKFIEPISGHICRPWEPIRSIILITKIEEYVDGVKVTFIYEDFKEHTYSDFMSYVIKRLQKYDIVA